MGAYRTIVLKGNPRPEEGLAGGAIRPGYLVKQTIGSGNATESTNVLVVHSTAAGAAAARFATEDALQGNTTDDNYALNDRLFYVEAKPGDEIAVVLAAGESVAIGDGLESAGNGKLRKVTSGVVIAEARETLDLTDTGAVDTHIAATIR